MPILTAKDLGMTPPQFEEALAKQRTEAGVKVRERMAKVTPKQHEAAAARRKAQIEEQDKAAKTEKAA
jgi:hypothetical protein